MELTLLKEADFVLSKCGRPTPPKGLSVVYLPKSFLVQAVVPTNSSRTFIKEVNGDTTWCLRAIQGTSFAGQALYIQIQLPDGKFLFNNLMEVSQFAGYGSQAFVFNNELECPPGTKIQVTLDTNLAGALSVQPEALSFDGAYRYYLKGGSQANCVEEYASTLPRLHGHPNQNILAPSWMTGVYPQTPCGYQDDTFIYQTNTFTADVVAGPFAGLVSAQIDSTVDFEMRRLLISITADAGVTAGTFLGRVRTGNGYALNDDYIDLAKYIGSAPMLRDFHVAKGDAVYIDLLLVDQAGAGNITFQAFLDGLKRRRA